MSIYENDVVVGRLTREAVSAGHRIFQIFQRGDESGHVRFLLERFNPSGVVLDIGCGIGEVARLMKAERPDLDFILLNISQSQLDMCPDYRKICANAEDIPLPDSSVDCVMACYVMGHLNKDKALQEMRRVLKPGGVLFIADVTGGEMPELSYVAHAWEGWEPQDMNTDAFSELMPDFAQRFPQIRPVIVREVMQ